MKNKITKEEIRKTINHCYIGLLMCIILMFIILKAKLDMFNFLFGFFIFCLLIGIGLLELKI